MELSLPILDIQYKDYAIWQRSYLSGEILEKQLSYWRSKLEGYENLNLTTDYQRPLELDYKGKNIYFEVDKELSVSLRQLAKQCGVSLYSLLLSAYLVMLKSYTNQEDLVIGTTTANRHYPQIENLIGFFVNTLALRFNIDSTTQVTDFIKYVGSEVVAAQLNQDLPFEKIVNELEIEKDTSRHPVFQTLFSVQSFGSELGNLKINLKTSNLSVVQNFDEDNGLNIYTKNKKSGLNTNTFLNFRPFLASREEFLKGALLIENNSEYIFNDAFIAWCKSLIS